MVASEWTCLQLHSLVCTVNPFFAATTNQLALFLWLSLSHAAAIFGDLCREVKLWENFAIVPPFRCTHSTHLLNNFYNERFSVLNETSTTEHWGKENKSKNHSQAQQYRKCGTGVECSSVPERASDGTIRAQLEESITLLRKAGMFLICFVFLHPLPAFIACISGSWT